MPSSAMSTSSSSSDASSSLSSTSQNLHPHRRPLTPGIYVPTLSFFHPSTEDLDLASTTTHITRLSSTGIAGIVTHGSNGEAVHLTASERNLITRATRSALDAAGRADLPIIVGCGAQCTRETVQLCRDAFLAGGDYALILPPSYYGSLLTSESVLLHFREVADASPVPVLIYNFPAVAGGLDLSSDQILSLAKHRNIVGVKLTCGNTGKLCRVAAGVEEGEREFVTMGGSADFILQTLVAGGRGVIAGLANLAPKACVRVMELYQRGKVGQAQELQAVVARGDWVAIKGGFVAVKSALNFFEGVGSGVPRRPCIGPDKEGLKELAEGFREVMDLEWSL